MARISAFVSPLALAAFAGCGTEPDLALLWPVDLRSEACVEPLALPTTRPRLSWRVNADEAAGARSVGDWTAAQVQAAHSSHALAEGSADLWDSGWIEDPGCMGIVYDGAELRSRDSVWWRVRLEDRSGSLSAWSEPATFGVGLLTEADWSAAWIGLAPSAPPPEDAVAQVDDPTRRQAPWLRQTFELDAAPTRALLHVASAGYHEAYLDGEPVSDTLLAPSVSDLSQRVQSVTYDVTGALGPGRHALGLWLGPGWTRYPRYGLDNGPIARAQLEWIDASGTRCTLVTDEDWRAHSSHVEAIGGWDFGDYGGERVDAARALDDWCTAEFDVSGWGAARAFEAGLESVPERVEPNRRIRELRPVSVEELEPGIYRADFGRTFTGVLEADLTGPPDAVVSLSFSEREAQPVTYGQRSELVLDGQGRGRFAHRFNHATARWVRFEGLGQAPAPDDLCAWAVRSDYAPTSSFRCSDPLLQRIRDTVAWTFECLTLGGYVVDCAHRERWGYGGDAHATMETALSLFDLRAFYADWLDDWAAIQDEFGNLPFTCPTYRGGGGPAWSGIVVMLPWELYLRTGDRDQLERLWPTIERWLAFLESQTTDGLLQFYFDERYTADVYSFLGDWVPPGGVQAGGAPDDLRMFFNNAYRVWAVRTAARIAGELGRAERAAELDARAGELASAVHERFFDPERGVYVEARQTYYALPVLAGLGTPELRQALFDKLVADVEHREHIDTGIHGTWFLVKLLLQRGRADLLQLVASQRDFPSWGHMLDQGATTIWEQWDGVHSRAHSSFLSIGAFFTEGLLGIRPLAEAPGYRRFTIAPMIGAHGLEEASGHLDTVRGRIAVAWETNGSAADLRLEVPPGSRATLSLDARRPELVRESGRSADQAPGVTLQVAQDGRFQCQLAPGHYAFEFDV